MPPQAAQTAAEWVMVARSVAQLPDGQPLALRSLSRAAMSAETVADWLTVADAWRQDFNDPEMARQCMGKAGFAAENVPDLLTIAKSWPQVFADTEIIRQCLNKAESRARDSAEWDGIAEIWMAISDYPQAMKCYRQAIEYEHDDEDVAGKNSGYWAAESERQIPYSYSSAIKGILEAEYAAEDADDWLTIAKVWKEGFQDSDNAIRCVREAEDQRARGDSDDVYSWVHIAITWKNLLQDLPNAVRCMEQAEEYASDHNVDIEPWLYVVNCWKNDFDDMDNYMRCLDLAGESLGDVIDMGMAAMADLAARRQSAIVDLGLLSDTAKTLPGTWGDECVSARKVGSYARYYSFTLAFDSEAAISLSSSVDAYLYLLDGDSIAGELLSENDDRGDDDADGLGSTDSRIRRRLEAGTYTIEATTYEPEESGAFTLVVSLRN